MKVAVRCRPMSSKETARGCQRVVTIREKSVSVKNMENATDQKDFTFDYCYDSDSTQLQVYKDLGLPIVNQAVDGFNGTIFAYGQTGSGKTFSMMGSEDSKGIIPQLNEELWEKINLKLHEMELSSKEDTSHNGSKTKFMVTASFLEVYNEEIKDLLNPTGKKLKIHESPDIGIYVEDLCELVSFIHCNDKYRSFKFLIIFVVLQIVRDSNDLLKLITQGNTVRRVASTNMNDQSSRSHSVFTIKIERKTSTELDGGLTREQTVKAKVNLVDLAGSERASKTGASGATLKEGANINLSLMTLGNVINALAEGSKNGAKKVIPYRNSKLTRLLQESLGGNSATVMIASISPADYNYSETIGTLKYANRAKSIANAVTRNEDSNERMIRDLQAQIEALKKKLSEGGEGAVMADPEIERKLKEMEASQHNAWEEKERLSKALEEERQANLHTVISGMMQGVKDQKVQHMKNIKRLTNEKASLTKRFKECKDTNTIGKVELDKFILRYQELQKEYDDAMSGAAGLDGEDGELKEESVVIEERKKKQEAAEIVANEMIELLTKIENERLKYTERRDELKRMRTRLEQIDEEITDERAELVATAGVLNQNDRLRQQIQEEEREKIKVQFEAELNAAKELLAQEKQNVRGTIQGELKGEMEKVQAEIADVKSLYKMEQSKNKELEERASQLQEYADSLESRLADSEVAQEFAMAEIERLGNDKDELQKTINELHKEKAKLANEIAKTQKDSVELKALNQEEVKKLVEEAKFDMFKKLMDTFNEERKQIEKRYVETQQLLSQAAKVLSYTTIKYHLSSSTCTSTIK